MTDPSEEPAASAPQPRKWPKWLVAVVAGGIAVVLVVVGLVGARVLGIWGPDDDPAPEAAPTPEPTESAAPSPFEGTPAEEFAEGADGIVLPEAEAVGDFTADEVAEALEQVREALIAARLDPAVMVDHELEPLLATMASSHQPALEAALEKNALGPFPTLISPDAALVPVTPRAAGRVSYEIATAGAQDTPILEVVTRFVWVYPFEAALVVVRDELVWEFLVGRPWGEASLGLWVGDAASRAWGVDCDAYQDGMLQPDSEAAAELADAADVIFDPEQPLDAADGC